MLRYLLPQTHLRWLSLSLLAFALLPAKALDYGLWGSTSAEIYQAMGWATPNIIWLWFALPLLLLFPCQSPIRQAHFTLTVIFVCLAVIFISAIYQPIRLGYAVAVLLFSLAAITINALAALKIMRGERFIIGALLALSLLILGFIVYPTLMIFSEMMFESGKFDLSRLKALLTQPYLFGVVRNSLAVSATVGLCSTLFGLLFALYTTRIAKRTRFIGKLLSILPMVTPPFVVGLGVALIFGRTGYFTAFLVEQLGVSNNWLYGFAGIAISHTLALTPMAFMLLEGALKAIPPSLEEASYTLGSSRWQAFRYVTLPLLKPALANAFLVVMIQSLADFSTPFVLGGNFDVIATQIYFYIAGMQLDYLSGSTLGAILLLFSLLIFIIQYRFIGLKTYTTVTGKGIQGQIQPLASGLKWLSIVAIGLWGIFNLALYGSIFYGSFTVSWGINYTLTFDNYLALFGKGLHAGAFPSLIQTVLFALFAAPLSAVSGLLLAYLLLRCHFKGRKTLEFLALISFSVPGTVAGLSYVLAFNNAPIYLTGTGIIIVLSMVTRNMPIGMRSAMVALQQLDSSLDEAAFSLTANRWQSIKNVLLPLLKPALLSALVTSFVRAMTTISAIIFLVTPSTRVATSFILNRVEDGDYGQAVAYGSTLIIVMMIIILIFNRLVGESYSRQRT